MSDVSLGKATGVIEIDSTSLASAATAARQLGTGLTVMGGLALGAFKVTVGAAADFEQKLDHLGAVTKASEADLERVRQKALEIGRSTVFGADEAIEAFVELGKAGLDLEDILGGVADAAINLAAAGDIKLARATEILVNTLKTFQLEASDSTRVADQLAGAANASTIEVEDMATSLKYAGSVADASGIPLEDVAAAIAILGNAGIKGSTAGTSLRKILLDLSPASKKARDELQSLGIITEDGTNRFFDAQGKAKGLADILQILKDATAGMTQEQRNLSLDILFGNRAVAAAIVLSRDGAVSFNEMKAQIADTTAQEVATARLDNLNGALRRLVNTLKTELIEAGAPVQDTLKKIVDAITRMIQAFGDLTPTQQSAILYFLLIVGILLTLGGAFALATSYVLYMIRAWLGFQAIIKWVQEFGIASKVFGPAATAIKAVGQALLFLSRALITLIVAHPYITLIVLALTALVLLYVKVEGFRDLIANLGDVFKTAFDGMVRAAKALVRAGGKVVDFFQNEWPTILRVIFPFVNLPILIVQNWEKITGFFSNLFETVLGAVGSFVSSVVNFFISLPGRVAGPVASFVSTVVSGFLDLLPKIPYFVGYIIGYIGGMFFKLIFMAGSWGQDWVAAVWEQLQKLPGIFVTIFTAILTFLATLPGTILGIFVSVGTSIGTALAALPGILASAAVAVANWVVDMVGRAVDLGIQFSAAIVNAFTTLPGIIARFLADVITNVAGWAEDMAVRAAGAASQFFINVVNELIALPGRIGEFLGNIIMNVLTWAGRWISEGLDAGRRFADNLWQGIRNLPEIVQGLLGKVIQAFLDLIKRGYNAAKNFALGLWNGFKDALFGSPHTLIEYAVWDMVDNVKKSVGDLKNQIARIQSMARAYAWEQLEELGIGQVAFGASGLAGLGGTAAGGDVFNNTFMTEADAEQIAFEIAWQKGVRIR